METIFLKIMNMSITASWLVLAVILLRFLLKKAPKAFSVILWGLVGIRLVLPFSIESILSLIPSAETVPGDIAYSPIPEIDSGIGVLNSAINPIISGALAPNEVSGANPMLTVTMIASVVWVVGIAAMLMYTLISYLLFRRKVGEAAPLKENIYLCDGIGTPFILGVIRPRIYLPSNVSGADAQHVIAHERAQIKRRDHLWKPLGFLLLAVYWFNPVLWIAYILLCRDIELACDERVIRDKGSQIKKSYSEALVNCSVPRKMIAACPLAFGEGSVKGRIKSVLNYKKPAFWIIIVSIVACVVAAVCFLTNPISKEPKLPENTVSSEENGAPDGNESEDYVKRITVDIPDIQTDINHNRVKETLKLEKIYQRGIDQSEWVEVFILSFQEGNEVIYTEEAGASHAGWNALFLYSKDGQDYLLRYNPGMGTGSAGYSYQLFYIGEDLTEIVVNENRVNFDINFGSSVHQSFDPMDIAGFLEDINTILKDSKELINTDEDLIKSFQREGRQYHIPQFLFGDRDFNYDYDKSMLENLEEYKSAMEAYYAEAE